MADKTAKHKTANRRKRPGQRTGDDSDRASPPATPRPGESTESSEGANECGKSVEPGSPQSIRGRNGGTLTPFRPGVLGLSRVGVYAS